MKHEIGHTRTRRFFRSFNYEARIPRPRTRFRGPECVVGTHVHATAVTLSCSMGEAARSRHAAEEHGAETDHPSTFFPHPGATLATALPNPASVLCAYKAGASHTLTDSTGASWGVCSFGLSAVIDEWTLFRAGGGGSGSGSGVANSADTKKQEAVAAFLNNKPVGAASNDAPASICAKANAEVRALKCAEPGCTLGVPNVPLCLFKGDGSMIGADALKAGPKGGSGGVAQLAAALQ